MLDDEISERSPNGSEEMENPSSTEDYTEDQLYGANDHSSKYQAANTIKTK